MEGFYQNQPSLRDSLRKHVVRSEFTLDIILEGALLSLGRCLDLVRPAGLLIGYVPQTDWKNAEMVLEHAVRQLRGACDPDYPLDAAEWGKLDQHYDYDDLPTTTTNSSQSTLSTVQDLLALTSWRLQDIEELQDNELLQDDEEIDPDPK